jgi:hypothetical protein
MPVSGAETDRATRRSSARTFSLRACSVSSPVWASGCSLLCRSARPQPVRWPWAFATPSRSSPDLSNYIRAVHSEGAQFNTFCRQARQQRSAAFVNIGNLSQEQMDWSLFCNCLVDAGLNCIHVSTDELAIDGDHDGVRLVGCQNPNH